MHHYLPLAAILLSARTTKPLSERVEIETMVADSISNFCLNMGVSEFDNALIQRKASQELQNLKTKAAPNGSLEQIHSKKELQFSMCDTWNHRITGCLKSELELESCVPRRHMSMSKWQTELNSMCPPLASFKATSLGRFII